MNTQEKMKTAQEFINLHNSDIRISWQTDLLHTYHNLISGVYGITYENNGDSWVRISSTESKTGKPVIFSWPKDEE